VTTTLYMLDTDTVSDLVRGKSPALDARVREAAPAQLCISAVTRGELLYGLRGKDGAHRLEKVIEQFLARVHCLPWGEDAATRFATVAADLHRSGMPIGTMDAMIAGHALAEQAVLVTNNIRHFERVAGLRVENWMIGG
jgi:tRNA(fMet)-specific endonuclease VapC